MSNLVCTLLSLHSRLGRPMTKSSVLAVCKMIELLKCVQYTFHRRAMLVAEFSRLIVNHYELQLLSHLEMVSVSDQWQHNSGRSPPPRTLYFSVGIHLLNIRTGVLPLPIDQFIFNRNTLKSLM